MEQKENNNSFSESAVSSESPSKNKFSAMGNKKCVYWGIGVVVAVLVIAGGIWAYKNSTGKEGQSVFNVFKKGESVGSGSGIGQTVWLGNIRVTLFDTREGTYRPLEVDEAGRRVTKGYYGVDIEVYNSDLNVTDHLLYGLTDDKGNEYERDLGIDFYLDDAEDIGPADNYIAQTLRRGFLLFPALDEKAKKLELTVYSKERDQKITFEIER